MPETTTKFSRRNAKFRENGLNGGENGVVAAARAPADFLISLKIFLRERRKGSSGHVRVSLESQNFFDLLIEFILFERPALNFVEADGIDKIFRAQHPGKLAHVEFRNKNFLVALQHFAEIFGERIQVAKMQVADLVALAALRFNGLR